MTTETLPATTQSTDEKRGLALLKAIGLDKVAPEQRELALAIADRYDLDLMLKHLVLIDGKPYITRDGLLHIAHRSGVFDGIEVSIPVKVDRYWRVTCSVWRKDKSRAFTYPGRFPVGKANDEEMAIKVGESMALRRAFDVSAPTVDERWSQEDVEIPVDQPKPASLAELARAKSEAITSKEAEPEADADPEPEAVSACGAVSPYDKSAACTLDAGHQGNHRNGESESW